MLSNDKSNVDITSSDLLASKWLLIASWSHDICQPVL